MKAIYLNKLSDVQKKNSTLLFPCYLTNNTDINLKGVSARGDGGQRLQRYYHHGSFAAQLILPAGNAVPSGNIDLKEAIR